MVTLGKFLAFFAVFIGVVSVLVGVSVVLGLTFGFFIRAFCVISGVC